MILQKQNIIILLSSILFFGGILTFASSPAKATIDECKISCDDKCDAKFPDNKDQNQACRDTCKDIEDRCTFATNGKNLAEKTGQLLSVRLASIDQQRATTQQNIQSVTAKMNDLASQIDKLKSDIREKENEILYQKRILANLMQSYYDYDKQGILELVLWNKDMSFGQGDYIEQSGLKVGDVLGQIKTAQSQLENNKSELQDDYQKKSALNDELEQKKQNLQVSENQNKYLLQKTQGEEAKYQQMLAQIEEQKKQLFNFSTLGNYNIGSGDKPSSKDYISTSWYYSQRDSRWKNNDIGDGTVSGYTMENWGCAVASTAMMETYYGNKTSPKDILKHPTKNFNGLDIIWPSGWHHLYTTSYKNTVDKILKDDDIAILHIARRSGGGHFVVVGGKDKKDYIINDPYFGPNIYLGASLRILNAYVDRIIYK